MHDSMKARVNAFFEEFPFISRYVRPNERFKKRPTVQRIDLDLLDKIGYTKRWIPSSFDNTELSFILIANDGSEIKTIKQSDKVRQRFSLWHSETWFRHEIHGETVCEGIRSLENQNRVSYILEIERSWCYYEITVHKVPAGYPFSWWISNIQRVAQEELKDELNEVDKV